MAKCHLWLIFYLAYLTFAGAEGARSLQQGGIQPVCPDGCAADGCIQAATQGGVRCQWCLGNLVANKATGSCACPAGKWASTDNFCKDCDKGSWCPGGDYYTPSNPRNPQLAGSSSSSNSTWAPPSVQCPAGVGGGRPMTTVGRRATSIRACVNVPGNFYTLSISGSTISVGQVTCPEDTFSPGLKKQRACVPCPSGYTTNGVVGAIVPTQCVVPPGYYLKAPGQAAPCPRGEYKSEVGSTGNCTVCPFGVTTAVEASTSLRNCSVLMPSFYAAQVVNGSVTSTAVCPQGYYCPGGPLAKGVAFNPTRPNPDLANGTGSIFACPYGMWTVEVGATAPEQCLTPPGHFTVGVVNTTTNSTNSSAGNSSAVGNSMPQLPPGTYMCPPGSYRAGWLPLGEAPSCTSCGDGVKAYTSDRLTRYNISTSEPYEFAVTTSADDCYILPGQGLYYESLDNSWRARNCTHDMYGMPNITVGLSPSPCRNCPINMVTAITSPNETYPNSASFFVRNGDAEGFVSELSCVNMDGYGYDSRFSQPCRKGWYNAHDTRGLCTQCPYGLTTAGVGIGANSSDCGIAPGFGYLASVGAVLPCPIGTYNDADWTPGNRTACRKCPDGSTTVMEGASTAAHCSICLPGWGYEFCNTPCGGEGPTATYGTAGRSTDTNPNCTACTAQKTGYSFQYEMRNDVYHSVAVSRREANSSTDCVAKWSQMADGAWYLPMPADDPFSQVVGQVGTFAECVELCNYDPCAFVTYDYVSRDCTVRNASGPVWSSAPLIAFRNLPSGDVGTNAWSIQPNAPASAQQHRVHGKAAVSTGMYTFYRDDTALTVGTQVDPSQYGITVSAGLGDRYLQSCLNACDEVVACAGVTIRHTTIEANTPLTCRLILGSRAVGEFKRTVVRADPERFPLPILIGR